MGWRPFLVVLFLAVLQQQALRTNALSKKALDAGGLPSDVKYIKCEVCSHVARSGVAAINEQEVGKKFDEIQVLDMVESLCNPKQKAGRWMRKVDLVERVRKLRLIEQEGQQECKRECRTMALACRDVLDGVETELAEHLYSLRKGGEEVPVKNVEEWLCAKRSGISDACRQAPPSLPKDREDGPPFEAKSEKDIKMENLMEDIQASNPGNDMGLNMMNAGQMGGMPDMGADDDDDDDDGDDDEDVDEDLKDEEDGMGEGEGEESEFNPMDAKDPGGREKASVDDTTLGFVDAGSLEDIEAEKAEVGGSSGKAGSIETGSDEL